MQTLLNEGDRAFFDRNPSETVRRRLYFIGERIDDHGDTARYNIVTRRPDGTLTRRFQRDGGAA